MKKILIIVLIIQLGYSCSTEKKKTDLDMYNLKGKVKSLSETIYYAVDEFGEIKKKDIKEKNITLFNENGDEMEQVNYGNDGTQQFKSTSIRNQDGIIIESIEYQDGKLNGKRVYKFEKGRLIEWSFLNSDGSLNNKTISKYDQNGIVTEEYNYDHNGSLNFKSLPRYNEKGKKIEELHYLPDGSIDSKTTYKHDEKENLIELGMFYPNSKYLSHMIFSYDYDEKGNKINETSDVGNEHYKIKYNYKKFDSYGNWILKIQEGKLNSFDGPYTQFEREIEYYN